MKYPNRILGKIEYNRCIEANIATAVSQLHSVKHNQQGPPTIYEYIYQNPLMTELITISLEKYVFPADDEFSSTEYG